jgi:hypothetical protein
MQLSLHGHQFHLNRHSSRQPLCLDGTPSRFLREILGVYLVEVLEVVEVCEEDLSSDSVQLAQLAGAQIYSHLDDLLQTGSCGFENDARIAADSMRLVSYSPLGHLDLSVFESGGHLS